MQNQTLPIQLKPTPIAPLPSRATVQPSPDGPAFSQTLNREMAQRQVRAPAPQAPEKTPAAPVKAGPTPASTPAPGAKPVKPVKPDDSAANDADAAAAATTADAGAATATATAASTTPADPALASADVSAAAAVEGAAAAAPMTDMLALVASYRHLMQGGTPAARPAPAAEASATASTRATGIGTDKQTLTALQGALKQGDAADSGKTAATATATAPQADDSKVDARPATGRHAPDLASAASQSAPSSDKALSSLREAATLATIKDTAPVTGSAFQAQLSSVEMTQTAVTPGSERIPARLGSAAWDTQVSQKVVWMVGGADQTASLTLNPPDLGPVQVVLNVNNDQATVAFSSATQEVRDALESAMPRLREMLSDAGVTLGEASVSANLPDGRQADTSQTGQGGNARGGHHGAGGNAVRSGETEIALPRSASRAVRDDGVVDTFA